MVKIQMGLKVPNGMSSVMMGTTKMVMAAPATVRSSLDIFAPFLASHAFNSAATDFSMSPTRLEQRRMETRFGSEKSVTWANTTQIKAIPDRDLAVRTVRFAVLNCGHARWRTNGQFVISYAETGSSIRVSSAICLTNLLRESLLRVISVCKKSGTQTRSLTTS